jgi:hypothetical protein
MKKFVSLSSALTLGALLSPALFATTMTSLSSFGGVEEPVDVYHSANGTITADTSFANITNVSSGTVQMLLRYSTSAWDGDRTTGNTDRGRAEVKTLGANQKIHETYDYTTTWKTNSGFKGSGGFCHITQLKPTDGVEGSSGAPLVVTSIESGTSSAVVRYASTSFSPANVFTTRTARQFSWTPGSSVALKIRIKTTSDGGTDGIVQASINGDALQGVTNVEVSRPSAQTYYPKWGLYRKHELTSGFSANDYVQHANVTANLVTAMKPTYNLEAESLTRTSTGASTALQSDANSSGGTWVALNADGTGDYVEYTTTSIAAGTYQVKMMWKGNTGRGTLSLKVDGTQVGGTLDQYSSAQSYPTTTFGNVTFASTGTHKIRLTVTGKNGSSSAYQLSADKFTLIGQ